MVLWYQYYDRSKPYLKEYKGFNLWYDYNNGKHHDMRRVRTVWLEHWVRRFCRHEAYSRAFGYLIVLPMFLYLYKTYNRFKPEKKKDDTSIYSGAQFVAALGRNQYGFESRVSKSFEHSIGVIMGKEIMSHILQQDSDPFRQSELGDEDQGLAGDFSELDILELRKEKNHLPHVGIVYSRPEMHYLNEKPNDYLSPYKV